MKKTDCKAFADFILQKKNLTKEQKAKISELVARDYTKINSEQEKIDVVAAPVTQSSLDTELTVAPGNPHYPELEYRSPKHLQRFMELLNNSKDDVILQYTSHLISISDRDDIINACGTEKYDLEKHSQLIAAHFHSLVETLKKDVPDCEGMKIVSMVRSYLTGKAQYGKETEGWSRDHITEGWGNKEFLEWGRKNPGVVPNPEEDLENEQKNQGYFLKEDRYSLLTGDLITTFSDLLLYYKSLIVIREEYSLKKAIDYSNQKFKEKYNNRIEFEYKKDAFDELIIRYTDVETLLQVYEKIVVICRDKDKDRERIRNEVIITKIELSLYEEGDNVCLSIHHLNSIYGKPLNYLSSKNARIGNLQRKLLNKYANGLCDIFIEAEFSGKQYARYSLWAEDGGAINKISEMKGVKYIIRF